MLDLSPAFRTYVHSSENARFRNCLSAQQPKSGGTSGSGSEHIRGHGRPDAPPSDCPNADRRSEKTPDRDAAGQPQNQQRLSHRDPLEPRGEGSPRDPLERMGAAQSSRDEIRRNLKLEFILAQARGLEGEALFDHMAAVTEAKIVGRSRPPSQMSQKSRTPRSRVSSRGSRPGTGRSSSIGSRPGTGQTVRFAKPFNGVTYGGFAIPTARRSHTPKHLGVIPGNYWGAHWPDGGESRVGTCHEKVDSLKLRHRDRKGRARAPAYIENIQANRLSII